jgi:hypothetical protein
MPAKLRFVIMSNVKNPVCLCPYFPFRIPGIKLSSRFVILSAAACPPWAGRIAVLISPSVFPAWQKKPPGVKPEVVQDIPAFPPLRAGAGITIFCYFSNIIFLT